jgi:4-aminobutyrate aminotransferase-like enzyme
MGLFLGIELVEADGFTPASTLARAVINALRDHRILTGTDGPYDNVIKIKGPMVVTAEDVDRFARVLREVLTG